MVWKLKYKTGKTAIWRIYIITISVASTLSTVWLWNSF